MAPGFHFGRILAATQIHAAEDRRVRLAFGGSFHPGIVWVNGERVATGDASAPVQLRKGPNTVVLAIEVAGRHTLAPPLNPAGMPLYQLECWLVPLDPETGSRDLGVRIGAEAITSGE
ncbi:MAG: hypothetical protein NTY17_00430 [Planctomycetia bacterium]|nr:hypothetical protein [Planctomycetia bacterium]